MTTQGKNWQHWAGLLLAGGLLLGCNASLRIPSPTPLPAPALPPPPTLTYSLSQPPPTLRPATAQPVTPRSPAATIPSTDLAGWQQTATLLEREAGIPPAPITALAFQPQGALLAAGSANGDVRLWQLANDSGGRAKMGGVLRGYARHVWGVAFSPDGQLLAVGTEQGVMIWRVATGQFDWQLLQTIPQPTPLPLWFPSVAVVQIGKQAWQAAQPTLLHATPAAAPTSAYLYWQHTPSAVPPIDATAVLGDSVVWASDSTGQRIAIGQGAAVALWQLAITPP